MSRKRHLNRNPMTDSQEYKICLWASWGAPYAWWIGWKVFSKPGTVKPSTPEDRARYAGRVYPVLKRNGISLRDWRTGASRESRSFFSNAAKITNTSTKKPKLRLVG